MISNIKALGLRFLIHAEGYRSIYNFLLEEQTTIE